MSLTKEIYIAEVERRTADLIAHGVPESIAYDRASLDAYTHLGEAILSHFDAADRARKLEREA